MTRSKQPGRILIVSHGTQYPWWRVRWNDESEPLARFADVNKAKAWAVETAREAGLPGLFPPLLLARGARRVRSDRGPDMT